MVARDNGSPTTESRSGLPVRPEMENRGKVDTMTGEYNDSKIFINQIQCLRKTQHMCLLIIQFVDAGS